MNLYERAAIIPGHSLTRSKAVFKTHGMYANFARVQVDESTGYIDMLSALGAVTLGNNALHVRSMGVMSLPHRLEVEAAEAVLQYVAPWASSIRFTMTGSEATHAAYRIAKAATGRSITLKGDWAYHGWHEWTTEHANLYPHGADLSAMFADVEDRIAAVFIEPHRWEFVDVEWLRSVRAFCDRIGALLIFDEMIYGARWALGGATEYFGVIPDIATFGKGLGNGHPIACVVGNEAIAKHGQIASGTFSGYPPSLQAVCDTIRTYQQEPVIDTLWKRGRQLQRGLRACIPESLGVCEGRPVHQRIRFHEDTNGEKFMRAMMKRQVLWHPACANVNYAHSEAHIERVVEAAEESVKTL